MNKRIGAFLILVIGISAVILFLLSEKGMTRTKTTSGTGPELFQSYCSPCHGTTGKGDGQLAYLVYPKPRDFTKGVFKLRSTPSGEVPTDEDLAKTIKNGMAGTAMPSFYFLGDPQIQSVVQYVKTLGGFESKKPAPIPVPEVPASTTELVNKGKEVYVQLGCHQCHGLLGKGDGQSAEGLKDDWGYPVRVRDFTQGTYLGGGRPEDLYLRFMTGLNGTPMPSYGETIQFLGQSEQERRQITWGLVHYVKSLETGTVRKLIPPADGVIPVKTDGKSDAELLNPQSPLWDSVPAASIPVSRLWQKDGSNASMIQVRAQANTESLAVLMEWEDASQDAITYGIQTFQDAAAVQFSLTGEPGFSGMGHNPDPCNIWFWRAEWQMRSDQNQPSNLNQYYRNKASDADIESYPGEIQEEALLAARDSSNIVATQKINSPVEDIIAAGPGTLTSQPVKEQNVLGKGMWDGKLWRVVFLRKLHSKDKDDVRLKTGNDTPVAFAVWNGREHDRNGQKLVSTWYTLRFQE